jgi:effector-binding domain-containing protein
MKNYQIIVKESAEIPYASLRREVDQQEIPKEIPPLVDLLLNLLQVENIKPTGECFFRYLSCTVGGQMVVDAGFPIEKTNSKSVRITFDSFPAGKYLSVIHHGDYRNLIEAHEYLENYSKSNNLPLDERKTDSNVEWGCRAEIYLTEPDLTPIADWKTEVKFLLK